MTTNPSSSTAHHATTGAFFGFVRGHYQWIPGDHPRTVRHLPTNTLFDLVLPPNTKLGEPIPIGAYDARLVHVGAGAPWPMKRDLAVLRAEAVLVRLYQHGILTLYDEDGDMIAPFKEGVVCAEAAE